MPKYENLAVCGLPRSGTTWMHNALIASGRYRGILADDMEDTSGASIFATDENRVLHKLLFSLDGTDAGKTNLPAKVSTELFVKIFKLRWNKKGVMLKSPYFCFFIENIYKLSVARKFIFIKRDLDAVSESMMRHPYIKTLLRGTYSSFFDFSSSEKNLEIEHVPSELLADILPNFDKLTEYDRALFKCLCFLSSFVERARKLPPASVLIINYDTFLEDETSRRGLVDFATLDETERESMEASYRRPKPIAMMPPHSKMLRNEILGTAAELWQAWDLHAAGACSKIPNP